jgi:hypothetical protein
MRLTILTALAVCLGAISSLAQDANPQGKVLNGAANKVITNAPGLNPNDPKNHSHEGLIEERGRSRAGGVKVHLQGRFQHSVQGSVSADGRASKCCTTDTKCAAHQPAK